MLAAAGAVEDSRPSPSKSVRVEGSNSRPRLRPTRFQAVQVPGGSIVVPAPQARAGPGHRARSQSSSMTRRLPSRSGSACLRAEELIRAGHRSSRGIIAHVGGPYSLRRCSVHASGMALRFGRYISPQERPWPGPLGLPTHPPTHRMFASGARLRQFVERCRGGHRLLRPPVTPRASSAAAASAGLVRGRQARRLDQGRVPRGPAAWGQWLWIPSGWRAWRVWPKPSTIYRG